ncbi:hypothetical protein QQZ08_003217 [Neonectria magnoliae]|uniref:Uncharacterized protein n=1 Tax=Neonectria magnoliae TaxID=2732573 RepID=A0ABR1I9H7_9HYPO
MASDPSIVQADKINKAQFETLLSQYPDLIKSISESKGAKEGQKTLQELDDYRYDEALSIFSIAKPERAMNLEDVKALVEWKLRHGKFRPTLMKFVLSNDPDVAADIIQQALDVYQKNSDAQAALDLLTKLKGIGPATASLLLTVHDPDRVIFFSDEAFYWLCCDGKKSPIKYNAKEYRTLRDTAEGLTNRLGVSATDVEKVAYVLMKQPGQSAKPVKPVKAKKEVAPSKAKKSTRPPSTKRKPEPEPDNTEDSAPKSTGLRRSKRMKA